MKPTGSKMLKVCSILMIISSGLGILGLMTLFTALPLLAGSELYTFLIVVIVLSFVELAVLLFTGILGVKSWAKPEKAQLCVILGGAVLVLGLISSIFSLAVGASHITEQLVAFAISALIPVLYIIGALKLKKMGGQA